MCGKRQPVIPGFSLTQVSHPKACLETETVLKRGGGAPVVYTRALRRKAWPFHEKFPNTPNRTARTVTGSWRIEAGAR